MDFEVTWMWKVREGMEEPGLIARFLAGQVHLSHKRLLKAFHVTNIELGSGNMAVNKWNPCPHSV